MRTCAFCPSTKLTREHVWADWVNRILPPTMMTNRRKTSPDGPYTEWTTFGIRQKAKIVCARCNNGWMSALEDDEAKPAMSDMMRYGGAVSILPRGIASIAAFGFKMAVVTNCIEARDEPYFCEKDRHDFAKTLRIPDGLQMWLFALNTPGRLTAKYNSHLGRLPANVKLRFEMYIGTFALGYFGLQVVASRWQNPHAYTFMGRFPGLSQADCWRETTIKLWPSDGTPVVWPPRLYIGSNYIDEFCTRWREISMPSAWMTEG